jgi:cytidylate kinase
LPAIEAKYLLMGSIIIAIDGHSACGKSSTARALAKKMGYIHVDSGAMYRAVALFFLEQNIDMKDESSVKKALQSVQISFTRNHLGQQSILLNGRDVGNEIRSMEVSQQVSAVSALPEVRQAMVDLQRKLGMQKGIIMDGRDIGTVVFPEAELKVFMTASSRVRAIRRKEELEQQGIEASLEVIEKNLLARDKMDSEREHSPLRQAKDSVLVDTTQLSFEQQLEQIYQLALERMN